MENDEGGYIKTRPYIYIRKKRKGGGNLKKRDCGFSYY